MRGVLNGVSPLIWRRLLVRADTTIADLHAVVQTAFGWDGEHLHRFVIHGGPTRYMSPSWICGRPNGSSTTTTVTDGWRLDMRVEQIQVMDPGRVYPRCTGGRRAGPPECCGGVQAFLENTQPHHVLAAAIRAAEILGMLLETEDLTRFGEHRDELAGLLPLLGVDRFDRRTVNRALAAHAAAGTRAA